MNRRQILTAAPALGCAGIVPATAFAEAETPVMRLYRAWDAARIAWAAAGEGDLTDEDNNRWCEQVYQMADDVLDVPSQGPLDFICKLMAQTCLGEHDIENCPRGSELWAEARELIGGAA
ncbi:hypothetical protein [Paracoccus rhizosphaerae]|uniref:Secreted protein n=1 Tax=Paracoccus rhizosphaerae TaxID=1133347 RepID=A0ABV6CKA5_9RHOB|nr:hypothetical protein [Paracoccus rhizosphaerae]